VAGVVPPQIESPKTFIGVGARELVILGVCGMLGILTLFIPVPLAIRVGAAVLVAGLGLALSFGRDRRSGKTIEAYLFDLARFYTRKRFRQKGTDEQTSSPTRLQHSVKVDESPTVGPADIGMASLIESAGLRIRPLPLGPGLLFSIISFAFLASLLAWIWLGGLSEIQTWFGNTGF
jgi:hypothetical protein